MSVTSHSGRLYTMNIIDDYSSHVWCLPLKSKSEAATILRDWHTAIELHSSRRLKTIVSDNSELLSNSIQDWCATHGIKHLLMAPHTSAQNGHAERLHQTIFGKAWAMQFACSAPPQLWDEFCATASYLTNLTASSSIMGKTPHELWYGSHPSINHLCEIGCKAYALIPTPNPKVLQRSTPCKLIGYAPNSKAYRLWDPTTGCMFNSFYVEFVEHLDAIPHKLLPGVTASVDTGATVPPYDTYSPDSSPLPMSASSSNNTVIIPDSEVYFPPNITTNRNTTTNPIDTLQNINNMNNVIMSMNNALQNRNNNTNNTVIPTNTIHNPLPTNTNMIHNTPLPPRHSSCIPVPTTQGLEPDSHLKATKEEIAASSACNCADCAARRNGIFHNQAQAFLCEFLPVQDTHHLIPLDVVPHATLPDVDHILSALATGQLEPALLDDDDLSWHSALNSSKHEYWIVGAREELKSLEDMKVFTLVPRSDLLRNHCPLKGKLVCKCKHDDHGNIVCYKVRYVTKGYAQQYSVDYDKTTAPTACLESFRSILHLATSLDWDIQQFDIKTAFLHGILPEDEMIFMEQPASFETPGKEDWVMKLMKSIYGMKQASRIWNQTFHKTVVSWGFKHLKCEWCVYHWCSPTGTIIFAVHVDDIISAASNVAENDKFREQLRSQWEISDLGKAKFALGIAISCNHPSWTICLSQTALIDRVISDFGQASSHPVDTPMVPGQCLECPDKAKPIPTELSQWIMRTPYRSLMGSLGYIAIGTRPDIAFAVSQLAGFLDCYRPEHWDAAIHILRYLKGSCTLALELGGTQLQLLGYSDSDYANCTLTS